MVQEIVQIQETNMHYINILVLDRLQFLELKIIFAVDIVIEIKIIIESKLHHVQDTLNTIKGKDSRSSDFSSVRKTRFRFFSFQM